MFLLSAFCPLAALCKPFLTVSLKECIALGCMHLEMCMLVCANVHMSTYRTDGIGLLIFKHLGAGLEETEYPRRPLGWVYIGASSGVS